jgi:Zn-dependent protease
MKGSLKLFRIAGIDIGIHYTWFFIFFLITWSLAQGWFPQLYPGWDTATYWITGVVAALLLFVSVLVHELAHSLVAQARGMSVNSITLFIFGGVSNLEDEPEKPKIEFVMAIVGPLTSLILAGLFWGLAQVIANQKEPLGAMLNYLAMINLLLALFNIIPAFPLDGGRVLRSVLWGTTGSLTRATNIAAMVGRVFGWFLIALGIFQLFTGNLIGGIWIAFIGWFLSNAAESGRQQVTLREQLADTKVKDIMDSELKTVDPQTSVQELVQNIMRKQYGRAVPVCSNGNVLGIVTVTDIKGLPHDKWAETPVSEIMTRQPLYSVSPEDDISSALQLITKRDINQVLILQKDKCVGLLNRADIVRHIQLSQELDIKPKK